jgi:subtilisin-like proprotein convertase family protein
MFHKSWEGGGTPATRLKDWLDPDNSGATSLDGRYLMQCSFFVDGSPASQQICAPSNAVFEISVSDNFTAPVNLTLNGPPAGLTVQFANNPVPPGGSTTLTLSGTGTVSPGTYYFQLSGTDGVETGNSILSLFIANQPPDGLHAISPANGASGLNLTPTFSWSPAPNATYSFQLATDANFSNLLANESGLTTTTYQPNSLLNISTTYFWRVNATNICGAGDWSTPFSFSTGAIACGDFNATNLPLPIGPDGGTVTVSKFMVNAVGFIDDVNVVDIDISHTYIGDLRMELTSPTGTTVQIMGNPNCDLADMLVTFNDESSNTYNDFENICEPSAPAVAGAFQPLSPLSAFDGEWAEGEWTLTVYDDADADGGSLNSWSLEICSTLPDGTSILVIEDPISCEGQSSSFEVLLGVGFAAPVTLSASNLPSGVTATFSPNPGNAGSPVTVNLSGAPNAGNYIFDLSATDGVNTGLTTVAWDVITTPAAPSLISPAQNATGVAPKPVFTWQAVPGVSYTIEVATDLAFTNIVESASALPSNQHTAINFLMGLTTYYWRVIPVNDCGAGEPSTIFSFTTGTFNCLARFYEGSQVPILDFEISNAIISFTSPGLIQDVNIAGIDISHTYIGDLSIFLTSPSGTVVSLLDFIDCSEADMLLTFDDEASLTNQDLQNSCSSAMPAVSGAFQPAQPLSSLIGENAAGDWTLTILDQAFDDVGFLHGWSLEICTSAPNDLSITPAVESVNSCETQFATFPIFLGQAFEPAITLSATGLPAGATATFEPNPASPGATVTVTLSNNAPTGSYPIEIIANDGVNISTATLDWNVTTTPGNPTASSPFPGQTNVGLTPTLNWTNISGANGYIIKVSTNPDLSNPIVETLVNSLSLNLTNLNFCTTYYWSVDAYNDCGVSSNPAIYPFTTLSNFDFQLSEPSGSSCANGDLSFEIEIGECYDPTGVALAIAGLPAGSAAAFSNNPAQPGSTVTVTLSLSNAVTGVFPISITGTDGSYSATATYSLTVLAPAAAPQLVFPADNQTNVSTSPTFDWNPVNGAVSYRLELTLASDPQFQDVLLIINTTQTGHTITTPLSTEGTYLWRVTAFNACGGAAPTVFTFQTEGENATWDLSGNQVQILPNPTSGVVLVNFSQPLGEAVEAVLFTVAGVATTKIQMQPGNQYGSLNLSEQPSGLYLLKLTTSKATVVERIVLDK